MLAMAQAGLKDLIDGEPPRRRPGLMNLITYGRRLPSRTEVSVSSVPLWLPLVSVGMAPAAPCLRLLASNKAPRPRNGTWYQGVWLDRILMAT